MRGRASRRGRGAAAVAAMAVMVAALVVALPGPAGSAGRQATIATAVDLVNARESTFDVYLDGDLVTPSQGLAPGSIPVGVGSGSVRVEVYDHVAAPPASTAGRTDQLTDMTVTVPAVASASIVIGVSPAGGVGLPYVSVFENDVTPLAPGTGRFVLRHTADAPAMEVEVISVADDPWTVLSRTVVERGGETTVTLPSAGSTGAVPPGLLLVTATAVGSTYALPPLVWSDVLVDAGEVVVAYTSGPVVTGTFPPEAISCPDAGAIPPVGATDVSVAGGDVDGDGRDDEVVAWNEGGEWALGVVPAGGGGIVQPMPGADPLVVLGVADANAATTPEGATADEIFVQVGAGAATELVQVWGVEGCDLLPVEVSGEGVAVTIPIGATVRNTTGVTCSYAEDGARLRWWQVATGDDEVRRVTLTEYEWDGLTLDPLGPPTTEVLDPGDEVTAAWASSLSCGVPALGLVVTQPAVAAAPVTPPTSTPARPTRVAPAFTG